MGLLHDIAKLEQEHDDLKKYLAFWDVRTNKRDEKLRRFYEVENELRVLKRPGGDMRRDKYDDEQIHV